jgi:hypothetical protein
MGFGAFYETASNCILGHFVELPLKIFWSTSQSAPKYLLGQFSKCPKKPFEAISKVPLKTFWGTS